MKPATNAVPPRVLVVMPAQSPRALIRAALRQAGFDAVGASSLASALLVRPDEPERGRVGLIIVDQPAIGGARERERLAALVARHGAPAAMLLARATVSSPAGPWTHVLRRPVSVEDVVTATRSMLPSSGQRPPLE